jgi:hypothetical protein
LLASCSNELVVETNDEGQEISFRLQGGMPEMRTYATATTNETINAFVVFGTDNVKAAASEMIFDKVTVAKDFTTGDFKYAPKRYYSAGATNAGFFAFSPVSPYVSAVTTTGFMTGGASFDYKVPVPDNSGDDTQEDFLVAISGAVTPSSSAVSLEFTHALSRIFVTATNGTDDPVIITGLTLKALNSEGTLKITSPTAWEWSAQTALEDYAYVLAPTGVAVPGGTSAKTLVTSMEQGMLVLPQETSNTNNTTYVAGDFALEVVYTFSNLGSQTQRILINNGYEFEPNKQYLININFTDVNFTGMAIEFEITVKDFEAPVEVVYP